MKVKRIIEIEEQEYKALSELSEREKVNELSYYEKIIAQSKPYDDSGDLISRSALKYKNLAEVNGRLTYVLTAEEIDNAPTIGGSDNGTEIS